ncbi:MAG: PulJ/GspJ family protein [Actinomycetota bacterium]
MHRRGDARGTTITELMCVVLLLSIIMATIYSGLFAAETTVSGTSERLRNLEEARTLIAVATKDVRTAVRLSAGTSPFVTADDTEAVFYANLDTVAAPKRVRIHVDAQDRLIEEVWEADGGSTAPDYTYTGSPSVRFVGRYVANEADEPIFTYLDASDAALTSTPLGATDLLAIKAVRITLKVKRTSAYNTNATTIENRVRLPNLDYNSVAG